VLALDILESAAARFSPFGRSAKRHFWPERDAGAHDHRALDHVAQLADIAGPGIRQERVEVAAGNVLDSLSHRELELPDERPHQQWDVLRPVAKRGNRDREHVQPIEEVASSAQPVDRAGDQFLADPGLTEKEHGGSRLGDLLGLAQYVSNGLTLADDLVVPLVVRDLPPQAGILELELPLQLLDLGQCRAQFVLGPLADQRAADDFGDQWKPVDDTGAHTHWWRGLITQRSSVQIRPATTKSPRRSNTSGGFVFCSGARHVAVM